MQTDMWNLLIGLIHTDPQMGPQLHTLGLHTISRNKMVGIPFPANSASTSPTSAGPI